MTIDTIFNTLIRDFDQPPYTSYPSYETRVRGYKVFEENNNVVFKCIATGVTEKDIDITFDKKKLHIKTSNNEISDVFKSNINEVITLNRSINVKNSFAKLKDGILTITMPVDKHDTKHKISFK